VIHIFAVYDKKVEVFLAPFFAKHMVEAIRSITQVAKDQKTSIGLYPNDYSLHQIGSFNEETGEIDANKSPKTGIAEISSLVSET